MSLSGYSSDTLVSGIRPRQRSNDLTAAQKIAAANAAATTHHTWAKSHIRQRSLHGVVKEALESDDRRNEWADQHHQLRGSGSPSHPNRGEMKDSSKRGQPTVKKKKMSTLIAIARPSRRTQVARASPTLVMAAPYESI